MILLISIILALLLIAIFFRSPIMLIILILILSCLYMIFPSLEFFSKSGLPISDDYCNQISDIYYQGTDPEYRQKICGEYRKHNVYPYMGNYYTVNGKLI